MEPVTAIAILNSVGVFDWIKSKFGDSPTASVAKKIVDTAVKVSGAKNEADVVQVLNADPVKAAQVAEAIRNDEMELTRLAFSDLQSARNMYSTTGHDQSDKIAEAVIRYNLPMVGLLVVANALALYFIKEATIAVAVGNVIGASVQALWNERQQVIGFFFGSSLGSKMKDIK